MPDNTYILLFDGVCNLCNASVQFVLKRDKQKKFSFASLQSEVAKDLLSNQPEYISDLQTIVLLKQGKVYDKSTAALHLAKELNAAWPLFYYFFIWWPKFIRDAVYSFISKHRYKWFGKQDTCSIPTKEQKHRFLDS